jgi:hypothetical protein
VNQDLNRKRHAAGERTGHSWATGIAMVSDAVSERQFATISSRRLDRSDL